MRREGVERGRGGQRGMDEREGEQGQGVREGERGGELQMTCSTCPSHFPVFPPLYLLFHLSLGFSSQRC